LLSKLEKARRSKLLKGKSPFKATAPRSSLAQDPFTWGSRPACALFRYWDPDTKATSAILIKNPAAVVATIHLLAQPVFGEVTAQAAVFAAGCDGEFGLFDANPAEVEFAEKLARAPCPQPVGPWPAAALHSQRFIREAPPAVSTATVVPPAPPTTNVEAPVSVRRVSELLARLKAEYPGQRIGQQGEYLVVHFDQNHVSVNIRTGVRTFFGSSCAFPARQNPCPPSTPVVDEETEPE